MTNERIAATAAGGELGFLMFCLVPHAAALGFVTTLLATLGSAAVVAVVARIVAARFGVDDPWREVGLDPMWDLSLAELSA
ncbi:hypothetical protein AFL01nite_17180 [Aeromicrobium flavum]|uniref:Uncharacterized protein n=1 Tax=Aeromicrobium flavum TaxID=416568 RepID=A0A512HVC2_9ACTN|nr:hypothetical protein [Aeromicrobium flavum]GEO89391.1 hypothetical protein AFL01nite_17180 [Aeromicrobium flavum]